jgi:uncharacterized damage-inducible protein DinB
MTLEDARRLFRYDRWANEEVVRVLRAVVQPTPRSLKLVAHVAAAERLWLDRLLRRPQSLPVWPLLTLDQSARLVEEMAWAWDGYLGELTAARLGERIAYTNSKGQPWVNTVGDVLHHVVTHSVYHRGQIASDMRAAGQEPAYTDFIEAVRRGYLDGREG